MLGQNLGARQWDRVRRGFDVSILAALGFTAVAWLALTLAIEPLIRLFHATGETADLLRVYCVYLSPMFAFLGVLFVSNAALNALGHPHWPTVFNWGRATLGTVPFVTLGSTLYGPAGVIRCQPRRCQHFCADGRVAVSEIDTREISKVVVLPRSPTAPPTGAAGPPRRLAISPCDLRSLPVPSPRARGEGLG